jgi:hypothetical protein
MADMAELGMRFTTEGGGRAEDLLEALPGKAAAAEQATDNLSAASRRQSSAMMEMVRNIERAVTEMRDMQLGMLEGAQAAIREAQALNQVAAAAGNAAAAQAGLRAAGGGGVRVWADQSAHVAAYRKHLANLPDAHNKAAGTSKALQAATLNLGRQMADVGVTAAMGMNPFMILIQQGPQIADALGMIRAEGVGVGEAFRRSLGPLGGFLRIMGPLAIIAAATAAALALFNRAVNENGKSSKEIIDGLNLTEKQLKRVKDETITFGDTMTATFQVLGERIQNSAIGGALDALRKRMSAWLQEFSDNSLREVAVVVGAFTGAWAGIQAVWQNFPAVMKDIGVSAANAFLKAIEGMVNKTIEAFNTLATNIHNLARAGAFGPLAQALGFAAGKTPQITGRFRAGQLDNPNAGAAADVGAAIERGFLKGRDGFINAAGQFVRDVAARRTQNFIDRVNEKAGPGDKAKKDPKAKQTAEQRNTEEERAAQVAAMVADAKRDELQATLALTTDIRARAALERQILAQNVAMRQAQVERQIASIEDDKGLSEGKKTELIWQLRGIQAQQAVTGLIEQQAINRQEEVDLIAEANAAREAETDKVVAGLEAEADILTSTYARAVKEAEILAIKQKDAELSQQSVINALKAGGATAAQVKAAEDKLAAMKASHAAEMVVAKRSTTLAAAIRSATGEIGDFVDAFRRGDWAGMIEALIAAIETATAAAGAMGKLGAFGGLAQMAGGLIGGRAGRGISGLGGNILQGIAAGGMFAKGASGALALGKLGLGSLAPALSTVLPVVGIVAGLASLAKAFQKPSNKGAGLDLVTGAISGKSRDQETEAAVRQAGGAITDAVSLIKGAGIELTDSIRGLVIGTRDQSQIYTASGKTLKSAVGDPAAAVEAALQELLSSAKFIDETQEKLVRSMQAAGKGFDEIAKALEGYAAAQAMVTAVTDEITRLTDPDKFAAIQQQRTAEARRKEAQAAFDAGYLSAEKFAELNRQLDELNRLEVANLLKSKMQALQDAVTEAEDNLRAAYEREAGELEGRISQFRALAESLGAFKRRIDEQFGDQGFVYEAASREFAKIAEAAATGDPEAMGKLQQAGEAFLAASEAAAPDAATNRRDIAMVRRAVEMAEEYALSEVELATQALEQLKKQVEQLIKLDESVLSVRDAIAQLGAAMAAMAAANAQQAAAAGDAGHMATKAAEAKGYTEAGYAALGGAFDPGRYGALNPDVAAEYAKYAAGTSAYQQFYGAGLSEADYLRQHFLMTGQYEGRGFAAGGENINAGLAMVGERGPELVDLPGGSQVMPNDLLQSALGGYHEMAAQLDYLAEIVTAGNLAIARNTRETAQFWQRVETDGIYVRGATPDEPVETA